MLDVPGRGVGPVACGEIGYYKCGGWEGAG